MLAGAFAGGGDRDLHRQRLARPRSPASSRRSSSRSIHGYASIDQRANQIVSGTAINMVADGITALIGNAIWSQGGRTPQLPDTRAVQRRSSCRSSTRSRAVPILGPIYRHLISGHDIITYVAFALRAADLLGALSARASACACARSARTRRRSTPPAFRCAALRYTRGRSSAACWSAFPASICRSRRPPISSRT